MAVCIPFLGVSDIAKSASWYISIGFACTGSSFDFDPDTPLSWVQLEWEGAAFMLFPSEKEMIPGHIRDAGLYFKVRSLGGLVEQLKLKARIIELTEQTFYGKQEVVFEDLNGYRITLAADGG
ncbi:MAG: hypothetical protein SGI83_15930 [Bacteroidota bacterium]|nr:hypothetical protein [Bacteroidota bacterium]